MPLQWSTTSREATTNGVKLLVYGEAGAGKTLLNATLPRPAIISAEAGLLSLAKKNLERVFGVGHPYVQDIPVLQVTTWEQLVEAYMYFANPVNRAREHVASISLDSITEVAEVILSKLKIGAKDPRQAYGEMADRIIGMVKNFRDLAGYNIYVSSKMEYSKDEATGGMKFQPMMPGRQTGPQLPYLFDEVYRLGIGAYNGKKYRFLQTDGDLQYVAKDRSGALDQLEPPDLTHVFNKIIGG
jgi:hypothetical protein